MALTHTETFPVRYYECDAYGHVNNANYPRYMAEAAAAASAQAGYDRDRYHEMGKSWLIRDTKVEYIKPIQMGDIFEIKTWVLDFHRVRSRRVYEFRLAGSDELMARGITDWIFLDTGKLVPLKIPEAMKTAFLPEGPPVEAPQREPFPKPPPEPTGAVTVKRKAAWGDVDPSGHVNNARYFSYLEDAGWEAVNTFGITMQSFFDLGYASVIRKTRIEYLKQVRYGDELEITTYLSDVKRVTLKRHFILKKADTQEVVARAYYYLANIDFNTGKPVRMPESVLTALAPHISENT